MLANPFLSQIAEFLRLVYQLLSLGVRGRIHPIVVNLVSLASAGVKIRDKRRYGRSHRDLNGLESRDMMSRTNDPIARTRDDHLAQLENGIVSRRKPSVRGESGHCRILQVSFNDVSQVVEFLPAGAVGFYSLRLE
jgi:hypothetical protein